MENITTRDELKEYFETGDRPTQKQFSELIDGYVHLNELNFGLLVRPTGETYRDFYDFYKANELKNSSQGHLIIRTEKGKNPEKVPEYYHVLTREVYYKRLHVQLLGGIDIEKYQPKVIIKRYRQRKKYPSRYVRKAGFYQETPEQAEVKNRKSEYIMKSNEMVLDIEPVNYFRPNSEVYKDFSPSGTLYRPGSFIYSMNKKSFLPLQVQLEILINGNTYRSSPVAVKVILGSAGETDAINFIVD